MFEILIADAAATAGGADVGSLLQAGGVASIVAAVVYLQRAQSAQLKTLLELVLPALDVRADVARLEGKLDALQSDMQAHRFACENQPANDRSRPPDAPPAAAE